MNSSDKKMKLLSGFICLAIVSCELKAIRLNNPHGTPDHSHLLLETGKHMTLSHQFSHNKTQNLSLTWTFPNGETLTCNNGTSPGRLITCKDDYSKVTVFNLKTSDTGNYNFNEGSNGYKFIVEVIQVSLSASLDDACKFVNIVAQIESTNYKIINMTSSYLDKIIPQSFRHHPFLFSIVAENLGDVGSHEWTITIRRTDQNDTEDHNVHRNVTLNNEADKCYRTSTGMNPISSLIQQPTTTSSSSVKSKMPKFLIMGFFVWRILFLYLMPYMLS